MNWYAILKRIMNQVKARTDNLPAAPADETTALAIQETVDERLEHHVHDPQEIAPFGAVDVVLTAGAGAFNWGSLVEIIASGVTTHLFDLHWSVINNPNTNGKYEIEFVYGPADTHACYCGFTRSAASVEVVPLPLLTHQLPAGSRIRARLRHSTGGATVGIGIYYHQYP